MTQIQGSAQAMAAEFPPINRLFMAGEIIGLTETGIVVRTTRLGTDRKTRKEKLFSDDHPVVVDKATITSKGLDVGQRVQFYGLIAASENRVQRIHAYAPTVDKASGPDANEVKIQGKLNRIRYFTPDSAIGKEGFAEALIDVTKDGGERRSIRAKLFQQMAQIWSRTPPGSDVLIMGRVNNRERGGYIDANGDVAVYTEVIADERFSRVLKKAVVVDRFAGVDFDALEAGMAPVMGLKEAAEEPKAETPAPAKKGGKKKQAPEVKPEPTPF